MIQQFSGATVIRGYVVKIFSEVFHKDANSTTHLCPSPDHNPFSSTAYMSAIITGIIRLLASLALTYLLVLYKRRTMYLASAVGTILSLALFSTSLLVSDHLTTWQIPISQNVLSWLSLVSTSGLVFAANLGVQPLPLLLSSELYPPDMRAFCKGISRKDYILPNKSKRPSPSHISDLVNLLDLLDLLDLIDLLDFVDLLDLIIQMDLVRSFRCY